MQKTTESGLVVIEEIERKPRADVVATETTPAALLAIAVKQGASIEQMTQLLALQERFEANEARKAFTVAMTAFKAEPLKVFKKQTVDFTSAKGRTHYKHATLSDVTDVVGPAMARHGLSYRWDVKQEAKQVTVACIVTHARGHSERVEMSGPLDDSGNKNAIQQAGSTVAAPSQRYTLLAVSGLSTEHEQDDDGRGVGGEEEAEDPLLDEWRAAALGGHDALEPAYKKAFADKKLWRAKGEKLWAKHGDSLKQAATKAEEDAAGGTETVGGQGVKIIACSQGSPEWKAARLGLATASCFDKVLAGGKGLTREKYLLELALERLTGVSVEGFESFAMKQGREREPLAVAAYEARTGHYTTAVGFVRHDTLEAGASPDRMVGKRVLEVKCLEPLAHREVLRNREVPSEYVVQTQGELWICEAPDGDFVSWNPDFPERHQLVIVPFKREPKVIDRLRAEVPVFLEAVRAEVKALEALP